MGSLIIDIQNKLIDNRYSIMDILRIGLVIANKLGAEDIKKWIKSELNGYKNGERLPNYRNVPMSIKFYNQIHGWCPVDMRNESILKVLNAMSLRQPISEIYQMSENKENGEFHFSMTREFSEELSKCAPFQTEFHYVCNKIYFTSIIDAVKTSLLEWIIELENNGIIDKKNNFDIELISKSDAINKTVINKFYGDKSKVSLEQHMD